MKTSLHKIWTFWIRTIIVLAGLVVPFVFPQFSDFWKAIFFSGTLFSLLSILNSIDSEREFYKMNDKISDENRKMSKLYDDLDRFFTEKELFAEEEEIGLTNKNVKNEVIIISNDLRKEFGIWKNTVIENIKEKNVQYTYFTSKDNIKNLQEISSKLSKYKIENIDKKLKVYYNDDYFQFMPQYGEIVIYKKLEDNCIHCFICFCDKAIDPESTEDNLLYEKVNPLFIQKLIPKIEKFEQIFSEEKLKEQCKDCTHNSLWEKYTFETKKK